MSLELALGGRPKTSVSKRLGYEGSKEASWCLSLTFNETALAQVVGNVSMSNLWIPPSDS